MIFYGYDHSIKWLYTDLRDVYVFGPRRFSGGYYTYLCFGFWDWDVDDDFGLWKTTHSKDSANKHITDLRKSALFEEVV